MEMAEAGWISSFDDTKEIWEWYYSETFPVEEFAKWIKRGWSSNLIMYRSCQQGLFSKMIYNELLLKRKWMIF